MGEVWVTTACLALIEAATSDYNSSGAWHRKGVLSSSGTSLARVKFMRLACLIGPITEFPHPLSRVKQQADYRLLYQIADSLIWLGIPVTYLSDSQGSETDVPHAYIWSLHLVPKSKGLL
ncbi:hypothetical protein VNO78_12556 [Psophocarpus tetragonolobus]|uniref:Uncharacterized protein n=1 Tax=Psophocarpus tetragonolobus TaxID=3891 RepID=A0AAN9SNJ6_PSOTE